MAGIEQLEIHSKSYIVRWVKVEDGCTVSWSVQPHKKSINFGIVKHPGTGGTNLATTTTLSEDALGPDTDGASTDGKGGLFSKRDASTAQEQLSKKGFIMVKWHGKCAADKVTTGTHDVPPGKSGMYGMVFDNTFSKQTSKHATFVVLTYPTGSAPQPSRNLSNLTASSNPNASRTSLGNTATQGQQQQQQQQYHQSPLLGANASESLDSLHSHLAPGGGRRGTSVASQGGVGPGTPANCHTGILLKRRRKKGQGYARRFFSLDFATCTLSYYHNRNTSALRGAIPLSLAAIAADERRREISIDSGAEIWHLKAPNDKDFAEWAAALTRATRIARGIEPSSASGDGAFPHNASGPGGHQSSQPAPANNPEEEDREWQQVEALVSRVVGTRDALRRLVKDMAQNQSPKAAFQHNQHHQLVFAARPRSSGTPSVVEEGDGYFQTPPAEKKSFWRRKSSATLQATPTSGQSPASPHLGVPTPSTTTTITGGTSPNNNAAASKRKSKSYSYDHDQGDGLQENCKALLVDLDNVVAEFSQLLATSKRRRTAVPVSAVSRHSIESTSTAEEFFDAAEGQGDRSELLIIDNQSDESPHSDADEGSAHDDGDDDGSSVSSVEDGDLAAEDGAGNNVYHPAKPKSLTPLPITTPVKRRTTVPPATVLPPSLIAFVRKNVGKDLSTISMPVSSNEPLSLLQRMAEQLEYAQLLDAAAKQKQARDRLLHVTAFAISQFSSGRARERAIRKPFNPLLGETFELLRAESEVAGGMRLLVEKVSHRPVRLAMHADGACWSLAQAPAPTQKFWGKSMELTTEGKVRVSLRLPDGAEERYSWAAAPVFLRNVVMGEKYVEPVGSMTVLDETSGARAAVEFRTKGMFGGRSEDVQVETWGADGVHTGLSLTGTWTGALRLVEAGKSAGAEVWRVGPLVENAAQTYGWTSFAASLNEVTELERGRLPPTDSRLRPDQRFAEQGRLDEAEECKVRLEEAQRARRRQLEERGDQHRPRWFTKVADGPDGDEVWKLKAGKDGYWEERARGSWTAVEDIFTDA